MIKVFTCLLILAVFALNIDFKLKADVNQGITIAPTSVDIKLKTEQQYSGSYTLTNNENSDFKIKFKEAEQVDSNFTPHDLDWFSVENTDLVIPAKSTLKIDFTLKVPQDAQPKAYTKLLLADFYSTATDININLEIPFKVNLIIDSLFASTPGVTIKKFDVSNKFILDNNVDFSIVIANATANTLTKPIGYLNIINPVGQIVYTTVLNESLTSVTQDKTYNLHTVLPVTGVTDVGQYTAQLLFTDSISTKSTIEKITFISINRLYIGLFVATIIICILLIRYSKGLFEILRSNKDEDSEFIIGEKKSKRKKSSK